MAPIKMAMEMAMAIAIEMAPIEMAHSYGEPQCDYRLMA